MQDLDVIHRQNAQASRSNIERETAAGKFVMAQFSGLNYVDYQAFDTERDRNAAAIEWGNASPGNRTELHNPQTN